MVILVFIFNTNMKEDLFYRFSSECRRGCLQGSCKELKDDIPILKGELSLKAKFIFKYDSGSKIYDMLNTGWTLLAVSEKITDLLEENNFTGWKKYDADFYDKKNNLIEGYSLLGVTGRAGKLDRTLSEKIFKEPEYPMVKGSYYYKGLYFEEGTWDGSDFFILENYYGIFITKRVFEVLKKAKLTNVVIEPISEYETIIFDGLTI